MKKPFLLQFDMGRGQFNDSISFETLLKAQCESLQAAMEENMSDWRDELTDDEVNAILEKQLKMWPMCAKEGCNSRACLRLNSKYCYPHTHFTGMGVFSSIAEKYTQDEITN